jgi:hypothetical protein
MYQKISSTTPRHKSSGISQSYVGNGFEYAKQAIGFNVGRDMRWDIRPLIISQESAHRNEGKTSNKMNQLQMSSKTSRGSCFQKT